MAAFPPDVFVLDREGALHARLTRNGRTPQLLSSRRYRFAAPPFTDAPVTPTLASPEAITEVVRRVRRDAGRIDRVSLLLPDSWFRMNILDLPNGTERSTPTVDLIRWAVKRTLPLRPEDLRFGWVPLQKTAAGQQVLAVGALDATLALIEAGFREAGVAVVLIEPVGLNVWNAIAAHEPATDAHRLFFYFGADEFTTGIFRGPTPMFLRSRNLTGARTLEQEIQLSASYVKSRFDWPALERCWVAGVPVSETVLGAISSEFGTVAQRVALADYARLGSGVDAAGFEPELTACAGVLTA